MGKMFSAISSPQAFKPDFTKLFHFIRAPKEIHLLLGCSQHPIRLHLFLVTNPPPCFKTSSLKGISYNFHKPQIREGMQLCSSRADQGPNCNSLVTEHLELGEGRIAVLIHVPFRMSYRNRHKLQDVPLEQPFKFTLHALHFMDLRRCSDLSTKGFVHLTLHLKRMLILLHSIIGVPFALAP